MDEMRDALLKLAYNIRKMTGGLMMEEKKVITLGDILDLLDVNRGDETLVTVRLPGVDWISGPACSTLWAPHEDRAVENIAVESGTLVIWLEDEPHEDED